MLTDFGDVLSYGSDEEVRMNKESHVENMEKYIKFYLKKKYKITSGINVFYERRNGNTTICNVHIRITNKCYWFFFKNIRMEYQPECREQIDRIINKRVLFKYHIVDRVKKLLRINNEL